MRHFCVRVDGGNCCCMTSDLGGSAALETTIIQYQEAHNHMAVGLICEDIYT